MIQKVNRLKDHVLLLTACWPPIRPAIVELVVVDFRGVLTFVAWPPTLNDSTFVMLQTPLPEYPFEESCIYFAMGGGGGRPGVINRAAGDC